MTRHRPIPEGFSKVYAEFSAIKSLISADAIAKGQFTTTHHIAQGFITDLLERMHGDADLVHLVSLWLDGGSTSRLRDEILPRIDYRNDYIPHFNAMALIDGILIEHQHWRKKQYQEDETIQALLLQLKSIRTQAKKVAATLTRHQVKPNNRILTLESQSNELNNATASALKSVRGYTEYLRARQDDPKGSDTANLQSNKLRQDNRRSGQTGAEV